MVLATNIPPLVLSTNYNDTFSNSIPSHSILSETKEEVIRLKPTPESFQDMPTSSSSSFFVRTQAPTMAANKIAVLGPPVSLVANAINPDRLKKIRALSAGHARKDI
jgi:hypothetical protein